MNVKRFFGYLTLAIGGAVVGWVLWSQSEVRDRSGMDGLDRAASARDARADGELVLASTEPLDSFEPPGPARRAADIPLEHQSLTGDPRLVDRYDGLMTQAERGDTNAARELGVSLLSCARYNDQMDGLARSTSSQVSWASEAERDASEERALHYIENSSDREAMCAGLSPEQIARWQELLDQAAAGGDIAAAHLYYQTGSTQPALAALATNPEELVRFRSRARRYLEDAATKCVPSIYLDLAASYQYGTVTEIDPARAFAYQVVAAWTAGLPVPAAPFEARSGEQRRRAVALSRQLFAQHCS